MFILYIDGVFITHYKFISEVFLRTYLIVFSTKYMVDITSNLNIYAYNQNNNF